MWGTKVQKELERIIGETQFGKVAAVRRERS